MKLDFNSMTVKEKVQYICVFVPILSTVAWGINWIFDGNMSDVLTFIADSFLVIGIIAALVFIVLTDLLGFIKFLLSLIGKGWTIGMTIFPIFPFCFMTAMFGFSIAFLIAFALCTMFPAVVTIYYYFFRKEI